MRFLRDRLPPTCRRVGYLHGVGGSICLDAYNRLMVTAAECKSSVDDSFGLFRTKQSLWDLGPVFP